MHFNNLVQALDSDPDLATLSRSSLPSTCQMLFVCTGCDYISFFKGLGKASFLNAFYQYAPFICGNRLPGFLSDHGVGEQSNG